MCCKKSNKTVISLNLIVQDKTGIMGRAISQNDRESVAQQ